MKKLDYENFIKRKILSHFSKYYNKNLDQFSEITNTNVFSWNQMIDIVDANRDKGKDYWVCAVLSWGVNKKDAEFFGEFIYESLCSNKKEIQKTDKTPPLLPINSLETIISFACIMSYAYRDKPDFYGGIKTSFEDYLLSLSSE
jgi:hypothetical protein